MNNPPTMRALMPAGFLPLLCKRTKSANLSNMSQVVNLENTRSAFWPAVVQLAQETNPAGYARWEAAHAAAEAAAHAQPA